MMNTMSEVVSYLDVPLIDVSLTQDMSPTQDMSAVPEVMSPVLLVDGFVPPWSGWDCPNGDGQSIELAVPDLLHLVSVVVKHRCLLGGYCLCHTNGAKVCTSLFESLWRKDTFLLGV